MTRKPGDLPAPQDRELPGGMSRGRRCLPQISHIPQTPAARTRKRTGREALKVFDFSYIASSAARLLKAMFAPMTALAVAASSLPAVAAGAPRTEGAIPVELQADFDYRSDDAGNERNNVFVKLEPEITFHLPAGFSIYAHGVIEQVKTASANEDRYFKDEALFIEDLYLRYETGPFSFTGGKLNPGFGRAWDVVPGVYGTDIPEEYEMAERIGISAAAGFGGEGWGKHRLTAGTFFLDTSVLAHTLGTSRGTTGEADGGVSNSEDFSSFNLVLEGGEFKALPGFEYHFAYIHQAHGVDGDTDETGVAAYAAHGFDAGGGVRLLPMVELVWFDDFGGTRDTERDYATIALSGVWQGWNAVLSYTRRETDTPGAGSIRDHQYQVGFGYSFDFGLTADIAWKRLRESAVETDTVGILFTYKLEF